MMDMKKGILTPKLRNYVLGLSRVSGDLSKIKDKDVRDRLKNLKRVYDSRIKEILTDAPNHLKEIISDLEKIETLWVPKKNLQKQIIKNIPKEEIMRKITSKRGRPFVYSTLMKIKEPMEPIEVYMARIPIKSYTKRGEWGIYDVFRAKDGKFYGFGVHDKHGVIGVSPKRFKEIFDK